MAGRELWAGLHLLDRQMLCHDDRMAGCVDDIELTPSANGEDLYVTAIIAGPGALLYRLKRRRLGRWLQAAYQRVREPGDDPIFIPFGRVTNVGSHVRIDLDKEELATASAERWVRDHVISHIPGGAHAAK
ncbi:MAG: hypothetical protein M3159_09925 [Actinomycetota bacterium]|nr:hypothetical protein [Actinomycetota bacterium]